MIKEALQPLKRAFRESPIFNFNELERDRWVEEQAATIKAGSRVLDIGAGSCPYRAYFSHCRYETQDFTRLNPDQLRAAKGYGQIDYISDATAIPVPDGTFDVILCTEVLEHVPEPIRVVSEMGRILRPGGTLLLTAPLGSGLHQEPFHYYGGYTPHWYRRVLADAGFENIVIEPNRGFFKHYAQESIRFSRMTSPRAMPVRGMKRVLLSVFWLASLPWFGLILPLICHLLDPLDQDRKFTVGYHVRAVKSAP